MKIALNAGGEIDLATTDEIAGMMDDTSKGFYKSITEGIRYGRSLDQFISAAAGTIAFECVSAGANPGYVRSIRRVSVTSNDATAAAQKVSLYLNDATSPGNFVDISPAGLPFKFTVSDEGLILNPDDELYVVITGGTTVGAGYTVGTAYKEITVDKLFLMDF